MKKKKPASVIASFIVAAVLLIGGILLIVIPNMIRANYPVKITQDIGLVHTNGYNTYKLSGEITNVSDTQLTIKPHDIIVIMEGDTSNYSYSINEEEVILQPGDTFNFSSFEGTVYGKELNKLTVTANGKDYDLIGADQLPLVMGVIVIILGVVWLIIAFAFIKKAKKDEIKKAALEELCVQIGCGAVYLSGYFANSTENKKAVAKSIGWIFGAIISTIFLGAGVYKVYRGSEQFRDFILTDRSLYMLDPANKVVTANGIMQMTKNDFPAQSVKAKKRKIKMLGVDGKTYFIFNIKDCPLSSEELAARLTEIFVKGIEGVGVMPNAPIAGEAVNVATDDPFAEFAPASTESTTQTNADNNINLDDGIVSDNNAENK